MRLHHCNRFILSAAALLLLAPAGAQLVVVPGAQATVEGNINNGYPFSISINSLATQRYQQVYGASDFASLGGPALITQIAFRPDGRDPIYAGPFSSTLPDIQINLSTTSAAPDALSNTFADNVGANDTVVVPRGPLALSSAFTGPAGGPKDFDILINLATPFLYDPAAGNLLLDVRNFGDGTTTQFDAQDTVGDAVSRIWSIDVTATTGLFTTDSYPSSGLVTRFAFRPAGPAVPEPSSLAMLLGSVAPLSWLVLRRLRKK